MICVCTLIDANSHILEGKTVIKDLVGLYSILINKSLRLIDMRDDFVDKFFSQTSLRHFITEAKKLNPLLRIEASNSRLVMEEEKEERIREMKSNEELLQFVVQNNDALKVIQRIFAEVNNANRDSMLASAKLSAMHLELANLQAERDSAVSKEHVANSLYEMTNMKLDTIVSKINNNYGKKFDLGKIMGIKIDIKRYKKILYIKEVTRVKYVDTLVYYVQEILKTLYSYPVRLVVMEARDAYYKAELYPRCKPHTSLSYADVAGSDIFMTGFQHKLMESITANPSDVDFLIVLDRTGWEAPYLIGNGVEVLYTVSDTSDIKFSCPKGRIISYSKETLHVKYINEFDKLSMEEKISAYSSMDTVKKIIELMERGE